MNEFPFNASMKMKIGIIIEDSQLKKVYRERY